MPRCHMFAVLWSAATRNLARRLDVEAAPPPRWPLACQARKAWEDRARGDGG